MAYQVKNMSAELAKKKGSNYHCCVPNCNADGRYDTEISFHKFPKDDELRQQWIIKIKRDPGNLFNAPPSLYYIPDFITEEQETYLLKQVYAAPKPKWTQLSNRRLQNWGGLPHPKGMIAEDLPQWLQTCAKKIAALGVFEDKIPNHVLVNEYLPGQGIMPHEDGPLYYPTVSTISLGSHTLLDFYCPLTTDSADSGLEKSSTSFDDRYVCSVLLKPRSLILVRDDMYKVYLHGIADRKEDSITYNVVNLCTCSGINTGDKLERTTRVSLTIRYVPKILKAKLLLGNKR